MHSFRSSAFNRRSVWHFIVFGGFCLAVLLVLLAYWPGLSGGFMLDDYENLRPLVGLDRGQLNWRDAIFSTNSGPFGRPVAMATFVANMLLSGPDVWMFKYTNLMIHVMCGAVVFWLAGRLLLALKRSDIPPERAWTIALLVAALWMLAPLSVSTTLYLVQRMNQLAALFCLSGLLSYVMGREMLARKPMAGWALILSTVAVWLPLAAFSKENGVLLPLLLFVLESFIFKFEGPKQQRRGLYVFFSLTLGVPAMIALSVLIIDPNYFLGSYSGRPFTLGERTLTESRILFFYLRNLLLPQGDQLGLFHDDYVPSTGLFSPPATLISILGWISVCVATIAFHRKENLRLLLFGIWFFLAGHALESTIFPLELIFEHRNYLPSFGVFFGLGVGLMHLHERVERPKVIIAFLLLLPLTYGFATYQRADTWSSWPKFLRSAAIAHPDSPRVHVELASLYSSSGDVSSALAELRKVELLRPDTASGVSLQRLLVYCQSAQPIPESVYASMPATMSNSDSGIYTINTLRVVTKSLYTDKCPGVELRLLAGKLERWIANAGPSANGGRLWDLHYELAHIEWLAGNKQGAIRNLRAADRINPRRPEALLVEMRYQVDARNMREAASTLEVMRRRFARTTLGNADLIARYKTVEDVIDKYSEQQRVTADKYRSTGL